MNFKTIKSAILLITVIFISSCSSDEDSNSTPDENQEITTNEFTFDGKSYELKAASINDENTTTNEPSDIGFNLYNKTNSDINSGNDLNNITSIYFDISDINLQEITYTDIPDFEISINGTLTKGNFTPGNILLSDDNIDADIYAQYQILTINSLTDSTVDLTFSFTRNDGQVIFGNYSGNYITP